MIHISLKLTECHEIRYNYFWKRFHCVQYYFTGGSYSWQVIRSTFWRLMRVPRVHGPSSSITMVKKLLMHSGNFRSIFRIRDGSSIMPMKFGMPLCRPSRRRLLNHRFSHAKLSESGLPINGKLRLYGTNRPGCQSTSHRLAVAAN